MSNKKKKWWVYYKDADDCNYIDILSSYDYFKSKLNTDNVVKTREIYDYDGDVVKIYEMKYDDGSFRYFSVSDCGFSDGIEVVVSNRRLPNRVRISEGNENKALIKMGLMNEDFEDFDSEDEDLVWYFESDEFGYVGAKYIVLNILLKAKVSLDDILEEG